MSKSIDLILLMSICRDTEPPYWRVEGAALTSDEEHVTQLMGAFFMSLHYYSDVRLLNVRVTEDADGKLTAEVKPTKSAPTEVPSWLF